ncbi:MULTISPECIES: phage holin [Caproicibacterium]|jgi:phi LC3 family holin|uniref:Phage holin n=1 Tax=Caproicibacterium lactatifermentans TaxID=2666138 RepID=A0A859DQD9_9FIRM|nr:phage holin [Caproicibacterium lactatifermentans]ARP50593.1 phage holin [Ruminococcaceae bacterium CPB6]MDD4807471.1 phage holin [Oscillospiraceae bacterium]QKN23665.1 phage holin [Caproicibacterium lactatifermentans]QKO29662.1 phage holin [Caproicibacterium lactatifermentans]
MKLNWKVRIRNKAFWITIIPALLLLVQTASALFGVHLDLGTLDTQLLAVIDALFAVLAVLGVVNDPTTGGLCDSCSKTETDEAHLSK